MNEFLIKTHPAINSIIIDKLERMGLKWASGKELRDFIEGFNNPYICIDLDFKEITYCTDLLPTYEIMQITDFFDFPKPLTLAELSSASIKNPVILECHDGHFNKEMRSITVIECKYTHVYFLDADSKMDIIIKDQFENALKHYRIKK